MSLGSIHGTRCSGQMTVFFAKTARIWIARLSIKVAPQLTYVTGSPLSSKIFCAIRCSTGREPGPSSGGIFDDGNSGNKPRKRIIIGVVGNNNLGVWEGRLKLRFLRVVAGGQAQFSRRRFAGQELRKRSSDVAMVEFGCLLRRPGIMGDVPTSIVLIEFPVATSKQ
ncbi:hypothetical protein CGGC5_v008339 [Colletotrichum fructicola Nara gc5]|uniref:Uncharacterized protein n=1 Tax=Colletotrichum fructicola (strain Nara gc5) TaxID=1213859 RepID=A0A7J6J6F3_COLFN|nr:hypothetical protein CGGC5_v008339 [Colletotrichum fructicola Nara gc5]